MLFLFVFFHLLVFFHVLPFFSIFIFCFFFIFWKHPVGQFLGQFWAIWPSETERAAQISMDSPVLKSFGAAGAELRPIRAKMGRKWASLASKNRAVSRFWSSGVAGLLSTRWALSPKNPSFCVQKVHVQEIRDFQDTQEILQRTHYVGPNAIVARKMPFPSQTQFSELMEAH